MVSRFKLKVVLATHRTALHWACRRGHTSIARFLLQSGADMNLRTHNGELPADVATTSDITQLLCGKRLVSCTPQLCSTVSAISRPLPTPVSASVSLLPGYRILVARLLYPCCQVIIFLLPGYRILVARYHPCFLYKSPNTYLGDCMALWEECGQAACIDLQRMTNY